jgi:hypothetical protein
MGSVKAWKIIPKNTSAKPYIQLEFPMMDLDFHDVQPLYLHPTALPSEDLEWIEKRFDTAAIEGNLVYWVDLPEGA